MSARTWREPDHPRDPKGRFRDKTGGWVESLSDAIDSRPAADPLASARVDRRPRVTGRDVTDQIDFAAIEEVEYGVDFDDERSSRDNWLAEIYEYQGFEGRPTVAPKAAVDELIRDHGWTELWRGVKPYINAETEETVTAEELVHDFQHGPAHYPGIGIYGNGTYTTPVMKFARTYAERGAELDALSFEEEDALGNDGLYEWERPHYYPGLMRMALPPDARVIESFELFKLWRDYEHRQLDTRTDEEFQDDAPLPFDSQRAVRILRDPGRFAAALGYDAIYHQGVGGTDDTWVVLNRTAVVVQEGHR